MFRGKSVLVVWLRRNIWVVGVPPWFLMSPCSTNGGWGYLAWNLFVTVLSFLIPPRLATVTSLLYSAARYAASINTPNSTTNSSSLFCWNLISNWSIIAFITCLEIASSCITWSPSLLWRPLLKWMYQNDLPTALEVQCPYFPLMQNVISFSANPEVSQAFLTAEQIFLVVLYCTVVAFLPTSKDCCSMHTAKPAQWDSYQQ